MTKVIQINKTGVLIAFLVFNAITRIEADSWIDIPVPELVKSEKVILAGKIGPIEDTKIGGELTGQATGLIEVTKVVKNTQPGLELKEGDKVELIMPSPNSKTLKSSDIIFSEGQEGVWLLEQNKDGQFEATYPRDFQPLEMLAEIEGLVKGSSATR